MQSEVFDHIFLFLGSSNVTFARHPHTFKYLRLGTLPFCNALTLAMEGEGTSHTIETYKDDFLSLVGPLMTGNQLYKSQSCVVGVTD